jgi:hypothetical protein
MHREHLTEVQTEHLAPCMYDVCDVNVFPTVGRRYWKYSETTSLQEVASIAVEQYAYSAEMQVCILN